MKKFVGMKKSFTLFLAVCLAAGSLSGCGSSSGDGEGMPEKVFPDEVVTESVPVTSVTEEKVTSENLISGAALISSIQDNFAAGSFDENYNKGQYHLPEDYVFEFPCSFEAGMVAFKAFDVYATPDFESTHRTYNWNTYEDGVIKVAPDGVVQLGADGSRDVNNGTWGSLNQLYLVQFVDLETGEDLEKPIVTPFSIEHEMKAPVVTQGVDEKNNFSLSWQPVPGAAQYAVYEYFGQGAYKLCCTTAATSVTVEEFEAQRASEDLLALFKGDLSREGYDVDFDGIAFMNSAIRYSEDMQDGYYLVIALDASGKASGISNLVDARDIAKNLPYRIKESVLTGTLEKVTDMPAFVTVEMVDGSEAQMIIDYHGAQAYRYTDDPNKIGVKAHVANTMFDSFLIVMTGMPYQDVVDNIKEVLDREDDLLSNIRSGEIQTGALEITKEAPKKVTEMVPQTEEIPDPVIESSEEPESSEIVESSEEPETPEAVESSEEPESSESAEASASEEKPAELPATEAQGLPEQLLNEVAGMIAPTIDKLGKATVDSVLYAESKLEAWMAYCLIAQSDVIPVPVSQFPEAADLDYLFDLFMETYRQNPTSGLIEISKVQYNDKYEALLIPYKETPEVRLNKTVQELATAKKVAEEVCDSSMTDYEKVFALNEYFRINASYDFDSMSTNVDISTASESFVDAHTPYGILCNNYGVCESYSEAFVLTARMAGLEAIAEFGTLHGGGHEWNRVKVDGKWCVLDITNNDNDVFTNGLLNLSDAQMEGILVASSQAYVDGSQFSAPSDENEYYRKNGRYAATKEEALAIVLAALKDEDRVTFRPPVGITEEEAKNWMKYIAEQGSGISRGGFNLGLILVEK